MPDIKNQWRQSLNQITALTSSIRIRLILLFILTLVIIFTSAGYYLQWQIRAKLDAALGKNLEALASVLASQIDPEFLTRLQPGDETTRLFQIQQHQLTQLREITGVNRVYIFGKDLASIVDSDSQIHIGQPYIRLKFSQQEVQQVFQGKSVSSILFEGADGRLYKTGFAPIQMGPRIIGGLAVEGNAAMLEAVPTIQKNLLGLGVAILIGGIFIGSFFANRITNPLKKLTRAAAAISYGQLNQPIPDCGRDEVGFLGRTLEEMRKNILQRGKQQQLMLAGVAHEIRNPLGGIELLAGLLANEIPDSELKQYAQKISKEVQHLKKIIQNFLDYARPAPAQKISCELKTIWNDALSLLGAELKSISVQLEIAVNAQTVLVDPQHLKQIFLNLLRNSIQAMPDGGTIFVKAIQVNHEVQITFSDSGPGITPELLTKIFEPFYTTHPQGSGLGLAVVKSLLAENGGNIRGLPDTSPGAHFLIALPAGKMD
ncbi:HAMP domain-containing histidine kinase [candidate division KSB1 bacterium]|nr:HAMP domain-containing histidine kinase [candidate division KSB1 bacterium]